MVNLASHVIDRNPARAKELLLRALKIDPDYEAAKELMRRIA
jgi:hypothetical protein